MSIVQSAQGNANATTTTATFGSTPTSGNTLLAFANSDSILTIGGSWTQRLSSVASTGFYIWERTAGASEPTAVTVTPSSSDFAALTVVEVSSLAAFDTVGTAAVTSGSAATATAADITATGGAGDIVFVFVGIHGFGITPSAPSYGNGFTAVQNVIPSVTSNALVVGQFVGSKTVGTPAAIGATTVTWTEPVADQVAVQIAYKLAGGGPGTATFVGAVATAAAAGVPGTFDAASDGGTYAARSGAWSACIEYAARTTWL